MKYGLAKIAEEQSQAQIDPVKAGLGGLAALWWSGDYLTGKKTMYHGTTQENWDNIRSEGLRPDVGGSGASAQINRPDYVEASKGNIHLTRFRPIATMYANMAGKDMGDPSARKNLNMGWVDNPQGKVLKIKMDYDKFNDMRIDNAGRDDISNIPERERVMAKNFAAKGNVHISPEEIAGSDATLKQRLTHTLGALPDYVRNNPKRFGAGLGLAGLGALGIGSAVDQMTE